MAWDKTKPVTNSALLSAEIRANWDALDTALMAVLAAGPAQSLLIIAAGGVAGKINPGTAAHVLTMVGGVPTWQALPVDPGFANPMTGVGDLIRGGTSGAPTRLGVGSNGQWLTLSGGIPAWAALPVDPGFANPLTTLGDLFVGAAAGAPSRLGIGTTAHVLTVVAGVPAWAALPVDPGFANPMTGVGDLIRGGTSGAPTRLGVGSNGQWLTLSGGVPAWAALPVDPGFANPMTAAGDLIVGGASGAPGRLPVGTNGYILTLVGGAPLWQPAPTGVAYPLLAPDGSVTAPSYSFAAAPGAGLYRDGSGGIVFRGTALVSLTANARTIASWWINAANGWNPGDDNALDIGEATFRPRDLWLSRLIDFTALASAPATPAAGHVITYAKTDKKMYAKDDAGVETPLGSGGTAVVPLFLERARFPDGTAGNLFPQPVERISTGTPASGVPKLVELVFQFDATAQEYLVWKGNIPPGYAGGAVTAVVDWSMLSATTGNVRLSVALGVVVPDSTDGRALVTPAPTISADLAVPSTLGQVKQTRLTLTGLTNVAAGRKFLVALSLYAGSASSAAGDRVLEAITLEFAA
jgi:hypothetical protein